MFSMFRFLMGDKSVVCRIIRLLILILTIRDDDDKFAILWNFSSDDDLIMRNICHESFHIAMSVCQFCNMSLGFKVGEDEHAAYIAGFAGDCVSEFINSKNTD